MQSAESKNLFGTLRRPSSVHARDTLDSRRSRLTRSSLAVVLAVIALVSFPAGAQQSSEEIPRLVETVDVRVINVDVVVTDRKGNPIRGLKMGDFEIYETGRKMNLTNFYEVAPTAAHPPARAPKPQTEAMPAAPAPPPPTNLRRRIIFFVDNLSLHPFNRNRVFSSMKQFAEEALRPGDEAMVATWNRSMKIRVPFTPDKTQIIQTLEAIEGESAFGVHNLSERRQVEGQIRDARTYSDAVAAARQYAQSVEHDLRQSVSAINGLMSTLAGVEGKKVLVLTSEGFPMSPGKEMFFYIDEMAREKTDWRRSGGSSLIESMSFDSSMLIQSVAKTANANNITLYTMHAAGLSGYNEGSAENARSTPFVTQQAALTNTTDSMNLLANMTGGIAITGSNNFRMGFEQIEKDLDGYYSLGYRAGTERVDRQRPIEVRTKNRNHIVRFRKSFVEKSMQTDMTDRVIANLFYESAANDMKIFLTTKQPIPTQEGLFKIPLEVHIPMDSFTLLPQGELHAGSFTIFVAAADRNGDMSDVSRTQVPIRIPVSEIAQAAGKHYTWSVELLMAGGRNRISVGVVDDVSNLTGFEKQEVLAADLR
jgi:VWFA-related protein